MNSQELINKGWSKTEDPGEWCHDKIEPFTMYADEAEELENRLDAGEPLHYVVVEIINRQTIFRIYH